jgi:hypothetical protein
MKRGIKQRTEVYHNPYNVVNKVIEFIDRSTEKVDVCVDQTRPSLINNIEALNLSFIYAKRRGPKLI